MPPLIFGWSSWLSRSLRRGSVGDGVNLSRAFTFVNVIYEGSAAIACIVEMAGFAGWFDNPEKFAVELLKARTAAIEKAQKPKAV
jgi:hypothetical protein